MLKNVYIEKCPTMDDRPFISGLRLGPESILYIADKLCWSVYLAILQFRGPTIFCQLSRACCPRKQRERQGTSSSPKADANSRVSRFRVRLKVRFRISFGLKVQGLV